MQTWEYMVWSWAAGDGSIKGVIGDGRHRDQYSGQPLDQALTKAGADRWELVSVFPISATDVRAFFKRTAMVD